MSELKDIILPGPDHAQLSRFSIAVNDFEELMDLLRNIRFDMMNTNVLKIYGAISGNRAIGTHRDTNKLTNDLQPELRAFLYNTIIRIISDMLWLVSVNSNIVGLDSEILFNNRIKARTSDMRSLSILEWDVLNACDSVKGYNPSKTSDQDLATNGLPDLTILLKKLSGLFIRLRGLLRYSFKKFDGKIVSINNEDQDKISIRHIIMVGHMLGHVIRALMIAKTYYDADYRKDKNEMEQRLVYNEFTNISSLGAMDTLSMICCYKNEQLLRLAVTNPLGELSMLDRKLLLKLLVTARLTSR